MKYVRVSALIFVVFLLIIVCIWKEVSNYFNFVILSALILQGVKAVADFALCLPMRVGYSKALEKNKKNEIGRLLLLFVGIGMIIFGVWWIATKSI